MPTTPSNGATIVVKREVALGFGERGFKFAAHALRLDLLRRQHVEIGARAILRRFRRGRGGAGAGQRRRRLGAVGRGLFEALLRSEVRFGELLRPVEFERGALPIGFARQQLRVRRVDLGLRLRDHRALRLDLTTDARDCRVLRRDLVLRRRDRELIIAVVDFHQQIARVDIRIVGRRHQRDMAGDFGRR